MECLLPVWDLVGLGWTSWDVMGRDGTWWDFLGLLGTSWDFLGLLGTSWDFLGLLGTSWDVGGTFELRKIWTILQPTGRQHGVQEVNFIFYRATVRAPTHTKRDLGQRDSHTNNATQSRTPWGAGSLLSL
jgi:hypothetical protein